jgi:hypothetical protein
MRSLVADDIGLEEDKDKLESSAACSEVAVVLHKVPHLVAAEEVDGSSRGAISNVLRRCSRQASCLVELDKTRSSWLEVKSVKLLRLDRCSSKTCFGE